MSLSSRLSATPRLVWCFALLYFILSMTSQSTLSNFFQRHTSEKTPKKRPASPIDLTVSDDDGSVQRKKPRTNTGEGTSNLRTTEDWSFSPDKPRKMASPTPAQRQRREKFKMKLLQDNGSSLWRSSQAPQTEPDPMDVQEENSLVSEEDSCDGAFQKLTEIFSHKSKGKSKATASPKRTKRHVEIGPSGQAYTPLELQVGASQYFDWFLTEL